MWQLERYFKVLHTEPVKGPIRNRVRTGIQNLIQLQPSPYVTQVLGFCFEGHNSIMISELAPYGDLKDFVNSQYYSGKFQSKNSIEKFDKKVQKFELLG